MKAQGKEVTLKVFSTKATVKPNAIKKIKAQNSSGKKAKSGKKANKPSSEKKMRKKSEPNSV